MINYNSTCPLSQQQLLSEYFMEIRAQLLDVAAFLDRMDRSVDCDATNDFRILAMRQALQHLCSSEPGRVLAIQMAFSDPTTEPLEQLDRKSAFGAFNALTKESR
jgi:hypothetical protein